MSGFQTRLLGDGYRPAAALNTGVAAPRYDAGLLTAATALLALGLVMVASASIATAERDYGDAHYFLRRQLFALSVGLLAAAAVLRLPLRLWRSCSTPLLLVAFALLALALIPGIGREINGSMRRIYLGPLSLQGSEPAKLCVLAYIAACLARHRAPARRNSSAGFVGGGFVRAGFVKPAFVVALIAGLLLLEPDYGSAVVLFGAVFGMLFLAGAPLRGFLAWAAATAVALVGLAVLSPYRLQRLTTFMDPWRDPFDAGFQLTQALIAFGRGEWFGVGLGGSVQKLFYLPEAHTDFLFAVLAEELGLFACLAVIAAFFYIVWRAFAIAAAAERRGQAFSASLAGGVGLILGIQAFVNMGVNTGLLPTKGLTLPLLSYGGSSLVVSCVLIALLLRVDYETRRDGGDSIPEAATPYAA